MFMKPIHNSRFFSNQYKDGFSINPQDLSALKMICEIKHKHKIIMSVISMGPLGAVDALARCLYHGADKGYLVSDRKLSFSDTLKTGEVLSLASKTCGLYDYYIFGSKSLDGETGQVGIVFSTIMNLPIVLDVVNIIHIDKSGVILLNKNGEKVFAPNHSVIVVNSAKVKDFLTFFDMQKEISEPVIFSLDDINFSTNNECVRMQVLQMESNFQKKRCVFLTREKFVIELCNLIRGYKR